jgi:3-deoxy-D-manno-octulosonate 8-phosphate phosphatase (KDO 8-P phosphatase)
MEDKEAKGELRSDLKERAKRLKLLLLDVDGVLTDGRLYYTERGEELKVFHVRDGLGIKLLQRCGIEVGVLSGRENMALINRLEELGIRHFHLGRHEKLPVFEELLKKLSLEPEEVAFVGDDLVDIPLLKRVGFPVAVFDAPLEVKKHALYITSLKGGEGAVREVAELILRLRGQWEDIIKLYDG